MLSLKPFETWVVTAHHPDHTHPLVRRFGSLLAAREWVTEHQRMWPLSHCTVAQVKEEYHFNGDVTSW